MAYKRLPNGFGNVSRLPGNRRKPFRARKSIGTDENGRRVYALVGYYETRDEALRQLALADAETLVEKKGISFKECLDLWTQEYELRKPMPVSYITSRKYLTPIYNREIAELRAIDLEGLINTDRIPRTVKNACVINLHGAFGYALRHEIVTKDYSRIAKYVLNSKPQIDRRLYTSEEIEKLWKDYKYYDMITLVLLYTGMRVSELIEMKRSNVHLKEGYMVGGSKTEAGRNRIIPIHSTIYEIVRKFHKDGGEYLFTRNGKKLARNTILYNIGKQNHYPHDTRHTFVTQAYKCGIAEQDIKRIVGHTQSGVTQTTYVHLDWEYLLNEIEKLTY